MDPFQVRLEFLAHLKRLNASQHSIQKVVTFAIKHSSHSEDLWDCIVEECQKGTLNSRINILYFLDSLCDTCLLVKAHSSAGGSRQESDQFVDSVSRDIGKIVQYVVPAGREGLPNLTNTRKLAQQTRSRSTNAPTPTPATSTSTTRKPSHSSLSRTDVFKRIEEDRERHKRLRERRWVQPTSHRIPGQMNLLAFMPLLDTDEVLAIDVEFENDWETTSDWNEDDVEAVADESASAFPPEGAGNMDCDSD
ncbi:CID domain-containing protein [Mycena kentingensis (nom. inval.)]|nr:CID domain-containing protein [Mycena kentingensis (nom. inval.)]